MTAQTGLGISSLHNVKGRFYYNTGSSCSKHHYLNKLVNDTLLTVVAKVFSNRLIFSTAKCEKLLIFSAKNISVFAIFQDRHFNITLANNFVRPRWLSWMRRPTGDQEVTGSTPAEVGNILSWRLIMKYFLRSFSPFR